MRSLAFLVALAASCYARAPSGPWDEFNYAPASKTVVPVRVYSVVGSVAGAEGLVSGPDGQATFSSDGSHVTLDFGKEVGGVVSLNVDNATSQSAFSLSFTESPLFINPEWSDDSVITNPFQRADGVESVPAPLTVGIFTQPTERLRGGFRYLTIVSNSAAPLTISNISVVITFAPHIEDLRNYTGYFYAEDPVYDDHDFLTKLWYAGAYTVQTNTIASDQGRQSAGTVTLPGWANNASLGPVSGPCLVDGAKRDRTVWPGDMGISTHTQLVSTNDLIATRNSLLVMFSTQDATTGALNYSGPTINAQGSDTYISWSLLGTHSYFLYTGDIGLVQTVWANYTKAVAFLSSQIDETGLLNVRADFSNDWGRVGGAGRNSAANALMYATYVAAAELAGYVNDTSSQAAYATNATTLKAAYNDLLWDASAGLYRDNDTTSLYPQDGNSLAVLYNLTNNASQTQAVSDGLTQFWTDIGTLSPELNDTIIPFVGGFEVRAHFIAGNGERALDLLRKEWGYMLYTNISVQSTLLEGFTANGSLGYRAAAGYDYDDSYTSHAHGWSTGPTPALTFHVLGLQLTSPQGRTWSIAPITSGLKSAAGGFETGLGWFGVDWSIADDTLRVEVDTPEGTSGVVTLPGNGSVPLSGGKHTLVQHLT
ncbi:Six-hairpin glycosidase [Gloeophyllum trabeum ATCC 11539]|uniref:Six-hairpin glycosidase n=1 Tax=Gloeophyllum trabeum (strain ATCC 11539 / FP-39264 / Madison 617) TaxID=670483 RepID=S7S1W7_GLOTA|nr:Six-hairpin glycosidase [Gloeophyllum trabeum ATCC 11539]EPQ59764.1 Six-hairpin glycosidase [Gloeophyllum trabeum ATCC 11539]